MRTRVALASCTPTWDDAGVPAYDPEIVAAALAELDAVTARYRAAEAELEEARKAVQEVIVRHLRERSAPPGQIATHSPYDRNHVGRLRDAAGIPPLRESTVKPAARRPRKKTS
jgi:hypothetical protein